MSDNKEYIGEDKVKSKKELEGQATPSGENLLEVTFDSGKKEIMSKRRFDALVGFKKSDASKARQKLVKKISGEIYALMVEYGLRLEEVNAVQDAVVALANDGLGKASDILWGVAAHDRDLLMINKILITDFKKNEEDNNGTTS